MIRSREAVLLPKQVKAFEPFKVNALANLIETFSWQKALKNVNKKSKHENIFI